MRSHCGKVESLELQGNNMIVSLKKGLINQLNLDFFLSCAVTKIR